MGETSDITEYSGSDAGRLSGSAQILSLKPYVSPTWKPTCWIAVAITAIPTHGRCPVFEHRPAGKNQPCNKYHPIFLP